MTTPQEYSQLAFHYIRLADEARDSYSRHQLCMMADTFMVLAKSTRVLEQSAKVLEALEQHQQQPRKK